MPTHTECRDYFDAAIVNVADINWLAKCLRHTIGNSRLPVSLSTGLVLWCEVQAQTAITFTAEQVDNGRITYAHSCARCHGKELGGGDVSPRLEVQHFRGDGGRSAGDLVLLMKATMPQGNAGTLSNAAYAELLALILQASGAQPGPAALPTDISALGAMLTPGKAEADTR